MKLPDKSAEIEAAIAEIPDGACIMLGGFGVPGTPFTLIRELVRQGQRNLTIIKNDANETGMGVDHLLSNGQVAGLITTHIGLNAQAIELMNAGKLQVEFCAQGILAERIRAGGAGLQGILTDIAMETDIGAGKPQVKVNGRMSMIETALKADFALVHAARGDGFGNLSYAATARNFNPVMAMAANCVIAEVEDQVSIGGIEPNHVHTPGVFVDRVVKLDGLTQEYAVVRR